MDQALRQLIDASNPSQPGATNTVDLKFQDFEMGIIEIPTPNGPVTHQLKPLAELYGQGVNAPTIDPQDPKYLPLFMRIEESIAEFVRKEPGLTDAAVELALKNLAMSPEGDSTRDPLFHYIQTDLRLLLSLENYSRRDVQGALRRIIKSVTRHSSIGGPRGYLTFISQFFEQFTREGRSIR